MKKSLPLLLLLFFSISLYSEYTYKQIEGYSFIVMADVKNLNDVIQGCLYNINVKDNASKVGYAIHIEGVDTSLTSNLRYIEFWQITDINCRRISNGAESSTCDTIICGVNCNEYKTKVVPCIKRD